MEMSLHEIINQVRANKRLASLDRLESTMRLREDLDFESLDLAELTVRIEERFGVDVFADGLVRTIGEIDAKITRAKR